MKKSNKGFDAKTIQDYQIKIQAAGKSFIYEDSEESGDEYARFFFIGKYEEQDVIFDAVLYTLRLKYESELYELAEPRLVELYPNYRSFPDDTDINNKLEEEMGLAMAEIMSEIEEEGQLKVQEEIDIDDEFEFGIGLEVSLNKEKITELDIENFVIAFTNDTLNLDPVLYSFEHEEDDDESD